MIIKFLPVGTGDPKRAVSYLLGELDHKGDKRADVKIIEGDPFTFSALAESVTFKHCYTSVVIAWSPQDRVTDNQISEVVSGFRQHIGAGLEQDQYHMTVIMHGEDDGSRHLHILIPRIELKTGKSFNVAPPGHRHYFDPLRNYFNYKYDWIRPDDVTRINQNELPQHMHFRDAQDIKAILDGLTDQKLKKSERVKIIDRYVLNQINLGVINNRKELVDCLKHLGKVTRQGQDYISLEHASGTDRLRCKFYGKDFSFSDHQINQKRLTQSIWEDQQQSLTEEERLTRLGKCFKEMHRVRAKRAEYNHNYYQAKGLKGRKIDQEILEVEFDVNSILNRLIPNDKSSPDDMFRLHDPKHLSIDNITKYQFLPHQTLATPFMHKTDVMVELDAKLVPEIFSSFDEVEIKKSQKNLAQNLTNLTNEFSISKSSEIFWGINNFKHFLSYQNSTPMTGIKYERYTITSTKKSIDCSTAKDEQRVEELSNNPSRGNKTASTSNRRTAEVYKRIGEVTQVTKELSRAYEERKLSYEQEVERYEGEVNRTRQDHQTLSSRTQQRSFVERTHSFIRDVKNQITDSFRKLIENFTDTTNDFTRDRETFETLSQRFTTIGIDRLVNIARQRSQRRQRIENLKGFKQDLERTKDYLNQKLALNTISAELSRIKENFPELYLKASRGFISTAERCFHEFRDASELDKEKDLYLAEYVYSIEECFKSLEIKLNTMKLEELNALKKLSTVIEGHLGQIQFETTVVDGVIHYESTKQEVRDLVAQFRDKLGKQERVLINHMLSVDGLSHSDFGKIKSEGEILDCSDYDNFS